MDTLETAVEEGWQGELDLSLAMVLKLRKFDMNTALMRHADGRYFFRTANFYIDCYPENYIVELKQNDILMEPANALSDYFQDCTEVHPKHERSIVDTMIANRTSSATVKNCPKCGGFFWTEADPNIEGGAFGDKLCGWCVTQGLMQEWQLPEIWKVKRDELENEFKRIRTSAQEV